MYVLSHVRLAIAIKAAATTGLNVFLVVDHTQMFCNGPMVGAIMNGDDDGDNRRVNVFENKVSGHMCHQTYAIVDNEVAIHSCVKFTGHVMTSAGVLVINDDKRLLQPLLEDCAQVLDERDLRPVKSQS
ncbi:hypothetical protein Gpo141_00005298 [Globisporangium polare]